MNEPRDLSEYCRQVETYLCRKNGGHLIRIVGPAFEQVCGWAAQGVPLTIVFRGIDQVCERRQAKGAARRPLRIEFCEADILDLFDAWRRAVGVGAGARSEPAPEPARRHGLGAHIDRAIARLTGLRTGARSGAFVQAIGDVVRELDALRGEAQHARGARRSAVVARLEELDSLLAAAALAEVPSDTAATLRHEAAAEIAPFADRMPGEAHTRSVDAAFIRLVREALGLPTLRWT